VWSCHVTFAALRVSVASGLSLTSQYVGQLLAKTAVEMST